MLKNWRQPMSIIKGASSKSMSEETMSVGKDGKSSFDASLADEGGDL
jgi:hypothetical protein